MKTKLVPFDIEKAKAGAKIVTRGGYPVRIGFYDVADDSFPILGLLKNENGKETEISYTEDGSPDVFGEKSELDLLIEEEVEEEIEKVEETDNYDPYKEVVKSISDMVEKYSELQTLEELKHFYNNVKVKCREAIEYDSTWNKKQDEKPADNKPKFKVGDVMRTLEEAKADIIEGLPVVVSIDDSNYHCNNETIAIKDQDDYEYPPMNRLEINSDKWYTCIKSWATVNMKIGDWFEEGHYYLGSDILKYKGLLEEDEDYKDFFRPWTIQDAKSGDILVSKNGFDIVIFKQIETLTCFSSYYNIRGTVDDGWVNDIFTPATIEQRELLFKKIKEAGYEWDSDKKELKKIEEPKFHKGDWVVFNNQGEAHQIVRVAVNGINQIHGYDTADNYYFSVTEESVRLWDITKDAKPGDVLCCCESGWTCIFKAFVDAETFGSYCFMDADKWFYETGGEHTLKEEFVKAYNGKIRPATKDQRDLFFQKIKERGYQWDSDKKELHKIEEVKKRRMTNQELAWWLRDCFEEHREFMITEDGAIFDSHIYYIEETNEPVKNGVVIRRNGGEWQEPLSEL